MLSVDDQGPPPAAPKAFNFAQDVLSAGGSDPDKIALAVLRTSGAERWSYRRLIEAVTSAASFLTEQGVQPGECVALRLSNSPDLPIAFLGTAWCGAVPAVIPAQWTAHEISNALALIDPKLIVYDPGLQLPEISAVAAVSSEGLPKTTQAPSEPHLGDPNRPGAIMFTSGTEGRSKPVLHAHRAIHARRMMARGWTGLTKQDRLLHPGAMNWTYTLGTGLLDPWTAGATALIPSPGTPTEAIPLLMRRHDVTILAGAPAHYRRLLAGTPNLVLPNLRHGVSAGEALSPDLRKAWKSATGTPVFEAFGMTECSTFISGAPERPAPPGTLGYAQPGRKIAILDNNETPVPRGTPGHIAIAHTDPGLMIGYLGDPPLPKGEWYVTADQAIMADDGALTYLGRSDDMLNAGGVRVSPLEVEDAIKTFAGISDCAVTTVTVKADTSVIAAFYLCDGALDEDALRAHISERLAAYKIPRLFVRAESLPRTGTGKLNRRSLRDSWKAKP